MPTPKITLTPCESSRIHAHGYCMDTNTMALQFKGKDGPGPVYHYAGFEPEAYEDLKRSESIGKFFGSRVNVKHPDDATKMLYPFTRIEAEKAEES